MSSDNSYKGPLECEEEDDEHEVLIEEASSTKSEEEADDPWEVIESSREEDDDLGLSLLSSSPSSMITQLSSLCFATFS